MLIGTKNSGGTSFGQTASLSQISDNAVPLSPLDASASLAPPSLGKPIPGNEVPE